IPITLTSPTSRSTTLPPLATPTTTPPPLPPPPLPPPPPEPAVKSESPYPDDRDGPAAPGEVGGGTREAIVTVKAGRDDDGEDDEAHEAKIAAASAHHEHVK
ncbi:hypothetical protein HID58_041957, partial [Brassica napus]